MNINHIGLQRLAQLIAWFIPKHVEEDTTEYFRYQAIVAFSLIVGSSGFPFMLLFFYMGHPEPAWVVLWSFVIFYMIPVLARRGASAYWSAHWVSANYYQCHLNIALLFGGVSAPNTMWFIASPLISILTGGVRHGLIWGGVSGVTVIGLYVLEVFAGVEFYQVLSASEQLLVHTSGSIGLMLAVMGSAIAYETLKDLSLAQRRRAEGELVKANADLKRLDEQKTLFFQNISHELRTPLTLILNPLEEASVELPERKELSVALKNAWRLLRLVNQLLDFQKLKAGKRKLKRERIEIQQFLYICGDYLHSACLARDIELNITKDGRELERSTQEPLWVSGEVDALEKSIFNLLSNALKYTPVGGQIEIGLLTDSPSTLNGSQTPESPPRMIRVFVRDTGPGIPRDAQAYLFEVFTQVDASTTRKHEGSGLGLALVKSLVEEMGGQVGVESAPGHGSTFWIDLERIEPDVLAPASSSVNPPAVDFTDFTVKDWLLEEGDHADDNSDYNKFNTPVPSIHDLNLEASGEFLEPARVLVVDDRGEMRNLIMKIVSRAGLFAVSAHDGEQGLALARSERPDLIITDWMMPKMSGPEMIAELRDDPHLNTTPVILLTAKSDEESKLIGTKIGADAFLGKPFNRHELISVARNLLSLKSREKEVAELNRMLTETVLKRYLPPALVDRIIDGEISMDQPELKMVTVMFSDICNFTSISESLGPQVIADVLNAYLNTMTSVIFDHGGTIDKFIGDGIMVMFGAPLEMSPKEQAERASRCGLAMQRAVVSFSEECVARGLPRVRIRIGVHQGEAVVGNFGAAQRADYTCIGPTVNIAARIESSCQPGAVYLSGAVRAHLPRGATVDAGCFELKGISEVLELYQLIPDLERHLPQ